MSSAPPDETTFGWSAGLPPALTPSRQDAGGTGRNAGFQPARGRPDDGGTFSGATHRSVAGNHARRYRAAPPESGGEPLFGRPGWAALTLERCRLSHDVYENTST